ncbi:MAG: GTP-binding protein, partial [Pseudomonadota bacterium]|nr:GTP-binding protein [Pseudomonadota bacterium]
ADLFLVTKSDLADETQMQTTTRALTQTRSGVPVLQATNGVIETDIILGIGRVDNAALSYEQAHAADHGFRQWSGHIAPETDRHKLAEKLRCLSPHIIRAKGIFSDAEGTYVIHYAGQRISYARHAGCASGHLVVIGKPELPSPTYLTAYFDQIGDEDSA